MLLKEEALKHITSHLERLQFSLVSQVADISNISIKKVRLDNLDTYANKGYLIMTEKHDFHTIIGSHKNKVLL